MGKFSVISDRCSVQGGMRPKHLWWHVDQHLKQVLEGIQYIHNNLRIPYGSVNAENVMINRDGSIKLGKTATCSWQDFRALGLLMVQLMDLRTSLRDPNTLQLQEPGNWNDDIKSFLTGTAQSSGETLQKVTVLSVASTVHADGLQYTFLESSPGSSCLKPLVFITERSVQMGDMHVIQE